MDSISFPILLTWWIGQLSEAHESAKKEHREYMRGWCARNPEKAKANGRASYQRCRDKRQAGQRRWNLANSERLAAYKRRYHEENREKIIARVSEWQQNNKARRRETLKTWFAKQKANRTNYSIHLTLASRIWHALQAKASKAAKTEELLGCTVDELKTHLRTQFRPGMTWDNYGEWHIDHIRPCASYDLTDPEQQRQCFNFKNLQPLWAKDNLSKGAKY